MYILIYSDEKDPLVAHMKENAQLFPEELCSVHVEDLLNSVEIFDHILEGKASLQWSLPSGTVVKNDENTKCINWVNSISDSFFDAFHPDDRSYAKQEFCAYLSFALHNFKHTTSLPGHLGMSGNHYPLPVQWDRVAALDIGLLVPEYYYGLPGYSPFLKDTTVVHSGLFNHFRWKPNSCPDQQNPTLAFLRPSGQPLFVSVVGELTYIDGSEVSKEQQEKLKNYARAIAEMFHYRIAELLFFVGQDSIFFASAAPTLHRSITNESFQKELIPHLVSLLKDPYEKNVYPPRV